MDQVLTSSFEIWPTELEDVLLISNNAAVLQCFQSCVNKEQNTAVVLGGSRSQLCKIFWVLNLWAAGVLVTTVLLIIFQLLHY